MRSKEGYAHYHEITSKWFKEKFMDFNQESDSGHEDVHHHKITDQWTGKRGEGYGWTYRGAESEAWDDLLGKVGHESTRQETRR